MMGRNPDICFVETSTGSEDFKKNLTTGKRYVDKTRVLVPLLNGSHETTFFLRPRRFGKTLTLSMIRYYVENTGDEELNAENRALFRGMQIMEMGDRYTSQMTLYPVIHLTFQTVGGSTFEEACQTLKDLIQDLYDEKSRLMESDALSQVDRCFMQRILNHIDETGKEVTGADYRNSLKKLTELLRKDAGKGVVVLIDEYDVPLEKAYRNGYYRQMVDLVGPLFQNVLKTNSANLKFAVVTGCLRIAKEGIYTGLNNPEINTVLSDRESDAIGFTQEEVRNLLAESGFENHFQEVQEWYDGYRFGTTLVYNPWSVIKHIEDLTANSDRKPRLHWAGTSENAIIRELAERSDRVTREKVDRVMQGKPVIFSLLDTIVYEDLFSNPDNVFNVMLATGYLTAVDYDTDTVTAVIPNKEVHKIFQDQIRAWFESTLPVFDVRELYLAMEASMPDKVQRILTDKFLTAMSYYDTVEAFYHGITLTLLQLNQDYVCTSNRESGSGRFDIQCKQMSDWKRAFIVECKVCDDPRDMLSAAKEAAAQIRKKEYVTDLKREGYQKIMTYGISFCEKRCRVVQGRIFTW